MSKITRYSILLLISFGFVTPARSSDDVFQFFAEEAQVTSASRITTTRKESPATVYVVTSQDIKDSGAQTILDALRGVPGVDIIQTRTNQGEVSIRGLGKAWNNRTLVLLNGRSMLHTATDFVIWESIPVRMQEIDRIEVVEGPASAIYGANAVNGVINIITKSPEKFAGGLVSYTGGERKYQETNFDYGRKLEKWSYRFGGGWRGMNKFERADESASKAGKASFSAEYVPETDSKFSLSGGLADINTQTSAERIGYYFHNTRDGFVDAIYRYHQTKYALYYKGSRSHMDDFAVLGSPKIECDMYYGEIEQTLSLPYGHEVLVGADYQRKTVRSPVFENRKTQNLWAGYFEDKWTLSDKWSWQASGRLDRHPYTSYMFSPRASIIFIPAEKHVLRLSAGTSFRNPTLVENSADAVVVSPNPGTTPGITNPPFTLVANATKGNTELSPERMKTVELAHTGRFGPVVTRVTGFYYKLRKTINADAIVITGMTPPTLDVLSTYVNTTDIQAWGGEFGVDIRLSSGLSSYANYSYQRLKDLPGDQLASNQSPLNKINAGIRAKQGGWTGDLKGHWVGATRWLSTISETPTTASLMPVKSYLLVNAHAGYAFKGRLDGLEAGVSVSNLLNYKHYEALEYVSDNQPGQSAEIIRARWTGTVSYRF